MLFHSKRCKTLVNILQYIVGIVIHVYDEIKKHKPQLNELTVITGLKANNTFVVHISFIAFT